MPEYNTRHVKAQAVAKQGTVPVPPINLMNIESVRYLFGFYPFLISEKKHDQKITEN